MLDLFLFRKTEFQTLKPSKTGLLVHWGWRNWIYLERLGYVSQCNPEKLGYVLRHAHTCSWEGLDLKWGRAHSMEGDKRTSWKEIVCWLCFKLFVGEYTFYSSINHLSVFRFMQWVWSAAFCPVWQVLKVCVFETLWSCLHLANKLFW